MQHQPEQVEVQRLARRVEPGRDQLDGPWGGDQHQQAHRGRDADGEREHRLREPGRRRRILAAEGREHGHERRREAAGDEHVERQLGQDERGVVGVELGARAVRPREDAVADEAGRVGREREHPEQDRAGRHVAGEHGAEPRDHVSSAWAAARRRGVDGRKWLGATVRDRGGGGAARHHARTVGHTRDLTQDHQTAPDRRRSGTLVRGRRPGPLAHPSRDCPVRARTAPIDRWSRRGPAGMVGPWEPP